MFRVKGSEEIRGFSFAEGLMLAMLLLALAASFVSAVVVSVLLLCCLAALWWLRRRYLASQQSLRQVKMLAHDILASMDRGVVTTNRTGIITSINSAGIRLLQVDFECVGQPLASISPAEVPLVDVYREVMEGQSSVLDREVNVDRAGRVLCLRVSGHVLKDREGEALREALRRRRVRSFFLRATNGGPCDIQRRGFPR